MDSAARSVLVRRLRPPFVVAVATLFVVLLPLSSAFAQAPQSAGIAKAVSVQGSVDARRAGSTAWQPVRLNDTFAAGDTIRVGGRSRADLAMLDQSVLRLN